MKTRGSTPGLHWKLSDLSKAAYWTVTDVEARKRGEQTGLDTLVVHAVNDEY